MDNKELEASFRKAKALGDDIREMESIDALTAYRQSQMKIRGLQRRCTLSELFAYIAERRTESCTDR